MKACDYEGVSFTCCETYADYRYEGLGDVLILNPKATLEDDVVETYDTAYRDAWHRA
jgi:hypothetical protein